MQIICIITDNIENSEDYGLIKIIFLTIKVVLA